MEIKILFLTIAMTFLAACQDDNKPQEIAQVKDSVETEKVAEPESITKLKVLSFMGIPFGMPKNKVIEKFTASDSVEIDPNCEWPVPPGEGQEHICFKMPQFKGYLVENVILVFVDGTFDTAYIKFDRKDLRYHQYFVRELEKVYGKAEQTTDGFRWRFKRGGMIILDVLKFPLEGKMKSYMFYTVKSPDSKVPY